MMFVRTPIPVSEIPPMLPKKSGFGISECTNLITHHLSKNRYFRTPLMMAEYETNLQDYVGGVVANKETCHICYEPVRMCTGAGMMLDLILGY